MRRVQSFDEGDSVYIGAAAPGKVHWEVTSATKSNGLTFLRSPMSGRRRIESAEALTLHSKGGAA